MTSTPLIDLPQCGITFTANPIIQAALEYSREHTDPVTVNHCLRSASFALLLCNKIPPFAEAEKDLVVLSCIFHDLGWSRTPDLISTDKRFEVDGADAARAWVRAHLAADDGLHWDARRVQLAWDAIALHSTPSLARHKEPEVAATCLGISADFFGPLTPGGLVTVEEHREIVRAFPRLGFHDHVVRVLCGFCRTKPETTYDNFQGLFGAKYGLDGEGARKEEWVEQLAANDFVDRIMGSLKACERYEE